MSDGKGEELDTTPPWRVRGGVGSGVGLIGLEELFSLSLFQTHSNMLELRRPNYFGLSVPSASQANSR